MKDHTCDIKGERCSFRCTGYDGSHVWQKIHAAADSIECEECRHHGKKAVSGLHDFVNAGLGKKLHDQYNFRQFVEDVNCVYKSCKADGRCI